MKKIQNILLTAALVMTGILMSCGGGGGTDPGPTVQEQILAALPGTHSFIVVTSPQDASISSPSATFAVSGSNVTFTSDGTSGLADFVTGGSFSISSDGNVTNADVDVTSSLTLDGSATITATDSKVVVKFTTKDASTRLDGIGSWELSATY